MMNNVNKECQKCGKAIDLEKESIIYLDSDGTAAEPSKRVCLVSIVENQEKTRNELTAVM
jgi:hypothetical protein